MKSKVLGAWPALAVLLALTLWLPVPAGAQEAVGRSVCAQCHPGRSTASIYLAGAHAQEATCLSCHHVQNAGASSDVACAQCHADQVPTHADVTSGAPGCGSCHIIHDRAVPGAGEPSSAQCRACHQSPPHALHAEAAAGPQCSDCHRAHVPEPLTDLAANVDTRCVSCHESAHPSHPKTGEQALHCTSCHSLSPESATISGAQLAATCTGCHEGKTGSHAALEVRAADPLTVPVCADCHSFGQDPPLAEAGPAIAQRCGTCHEQELHAYMQGGHAEGLSDTTGELPTCVTCHAEHTSHQTRLSATAQCIKCHSSKRLAAKYNLPENVGASYADDFHGATVQLLQADPNAGEAARVLVCADCHGAHDVGWDQSTQISAVCLRCHTRSDARLAGAWVGHARVGPEHQPLIWLVRLFYFFIIPFVLLGLAFVIFFQFRDQRRRGARMRDSEGLHRLRAWLGGRKLPPVPTVTRFSRLERIEHFGSMSTFILLVLTGLPQTRPELGIANSIIRFFGGIGTTRLIHRTVGVTFVALLVLHVARAIRNALRTHHLPVMVPTRQDFRDTLATLRHFLQGTPRPRVGKFDFAEKYEYWGLFLGGTLMSVTGAILLFPELVTRVLPGQLVAMFRVMHGLEATFAVLVVVLWHTYGVILRPEVFPLDTSIFTGKMSVERLKEEHELEYERLYPDGEQGADEHTPPEEMAQAS